MTEEAIAYSIIKPEDSLSDYIEFFWHLTNHSDNEKKVIILPDGYFDFIFFSYDNESFQCLLVGLATKPATFVIPTGCVSFAISFKLLAAEYLLHTSIAPLINEQTFLTKNFWNIKPGCLPDFTSFTQEVTRKMKELIIDNIDARKQKLFDIIYDTNGLATIQQMSANCNWSSRQINRYFSTWFGLSLKTYCNILRYRASFKNLKEGNLFPEAHFADQAHFIKEIKKFSAVTPKELFKNENDRFIQLSTLPKE